MWSMKKEGMKESREMYLKAIFHLYKVYRGKVRNIDIAQYLKVSRPSVTRAVSIMEKEKLIEIDSAGMIQLTDKGIESAMIITDRYNVIVEFLKRNFHLQEDTIYKDACQIEHIISEELYLAVKMDNEKNKDKMRNIG